MIFNIQKANSQLHNDIIMYHKNTLQAIIQHHNSGTEEKIVTIL